jgi:hypothetical protein
MMQVAERFPFVKDDVINTKPMDTQYYHEEDMLDIYAIIMYRLTALSSPKAFFTGAESIRFNGGDPALDSSMYPETVFYIPGYSETTDRDYILFIGGGNTNFTDLDRFSDLFVVSAWGEPVIEFSSKINGSTTHVYPTVEMENKYSGFYTTTPGGYEYDNNGKLPVEIVYGPSFSLNRNNGFTMSLHSSMSSAIGGMYMRMDNKLILMCGYADANYTFVFYYQEGEGYRYDKSESAPPSGYDFEDGTMFYFDLRDGHTGGTIDHDKPLSDRSRKLTAEEKAFVESLISMLEEPSDTNNATDFSYADELAMFPEGTPGVKKTGFRNTTELPVHNDVEAIGRAMNECTIEWSATEVYYDATKEIWKVTFYTKGVPGGDQSVYLDAIGITLMIVYGE